jgi:hypothetical protein
MGGIGFNLSGREAAGSIKRKERINMMGHILSFVIGAAIAYFTVKALLKAIKNTKEGKCTSCTQDCTGCTEWNQTSQRNLK